MNMTIEELLSEYWDIAHSEGATGVSRGTEAQVVLTKIREAITREEAQPSAGERDAQPSKPLFADLIAKHPGLAEEMKAGERATLLDRMPQLNYNNYSNGEVEELITWANEAADMLAADAPFAPDWANYRQGVANGRAEALEEIARLQAELAALKAGAQQVAVPQGLVEILIEASTFIHAVHNGATPKTRYPIVDELDGFAHMLAAAPQPQGD